ncbi:uncharacterized protein LOC128189721 [Crassostrea angulata]|uniref:uncharacterized protein LOC128189721 n=1 Tax=Magallana angulata TaxID=2784310 RepID=UPI0022B1D738|nr:uncharacterized protein LOC128189721 [Crassostrea angulata]
MSLMGSVLIIIQIILTVSAKDCNRNKFRCCYNEYFDANTGQCSVCMNGSIGWNCGTPCMSGFYGYLCSTPCECEAHLCDIQTGCQPRQEQKYSSIAPNSNGIDLTLNRSQNERSINSAQDSTRYRLLIMVTFGFVVFIMTVVIPANVLYLRWKIKRDIKMATKNSSERNDTIRQNYCTLRHLTSSHQDLINNDALNSAYDELHCSYM